MQRKLDPGTRDPRTIARYARAIGVQRHVRSATSSSGQAPLREEMQLIPQPVLIPVEPSRQPIQDVMHPTVTGKPAAAAASKHHAAQPSKRPASQIGTYFDIKAPRRMYSPFEQKQLLETTPVTIEVPALRRSEAAMTPVFLYDNDTETVSYDEASQRPRRRWFGFGKAELSYGSAPIGEIS